MPYDQDDFRSLWSGFLSDLTWVTSRRLDRRGGAYSELQAVLQESQRMLSSESALDAAAAAFSAQAELYPQAGKLLLRELRFFRNLIANADASGEDDEEAVAAGKTIKDSFEKYLDKLPEKWKKILDVLNEILSLAKGG